MVDWIWMDGGWDDALVINDDCPAVCMVVVVVVVTGPNPSFFGIPIPWFGTTFGSTCPVSTGMPPPPPPLLLLTKMKNMHRIPVAALFIRLMSSSLERIVWRQFFWVTMKLAHSYPSRPLMHFCSETQKTPLKY